MYDMIGSSDRILHSQLELIYGIGSAVIQLANTIYASCKTCV